VSASFDPFKAISLTTRKDAFGLYDRKFADAVFHPFDEILRTIDTETYDQLVLQQG